MSSESEEQLGLLSNSPEEEFGSGTELPTTGFIVFGLLTFWIYTVWRYWGCTRPSHAPETRLFQAEAVKRGGPCED